MQRGDREMHPVVQGKLHILAVGARIRMSRQHSRTCGVLVERILNIYPCAFKILIQRKRDPKSRTLRKRKKRAVKLPTRGDSRASVGVVPRCVRRQIRYNTARAGINISFYDALKPVRRRAEIYKYERAFTRGAVKYVVGQLPYAGNILCVSELILCVHAKSPRCRAAFLYVIYPLYHLSGRM